MKSYKYMHTIEWRPGFYDGQQVCYASRSPIPLLDSLKEIRRQQRASNWWRRKRGWAENSNLGYVKVAV